MRTLRLHLDRVRGEAGQFLRFCMVGGAGFVIDAAILLLLVRTGAAGPFSGRVASFCIAVLVTFEFNRRWAFGSHGSGHYLRLITAYLGVQSVGFACNFAVYALLLFYLPAPLRDPLLCLAVASAVALVVNFCGAKFAVFRRKLV